MDHSTFSTHSLDPPVEIPSRGYRRRPTVIQRRRSTGRMRPLTLSEMHDQVLDLYERPGFATQPNSGVEADLNLDFSTTFSVTDIKQSISNDSVFTDLDIGHKVKGTQFEGKPTGLPSLDFLDADQGVSKQLLDDAMRSGFVTINITNTLLFGMAGTGKTSIKHILFGLPPPEVRDSTPLADTVERVHIRNVTKTKVQAGQHCWTPVTIEDLKKFVVDTILSVTGGWKDVPEELAKILKELLASPDGKPPPEDVQVLEALVDVIGKIVELLSDPANSIQLRSQEILGSNWIYLTDSGGQPHFHNLLPLFIKDISAALFTFRLSEGLDEHPLVEYYKNGNEVGASFTSPFTSSENFKLLVRSLQFRTHDSSQLRLFCIGTFLDKKNDCSESLEDKERKILQLTDSSARDGLMYWDDHLTKIVFTFNAKNPGKHEQDMAMRLRAGIEACTIEKVHVPIWWYVLEVLLERLASLRKRRILTKTECFHIALRLNFHEDALEEALKLFHKHHIFHYYPDVLPNIVFCDTQVLLDKVTELVEYASYMRKPSKQPIACTSVPRHGKWMDFRDKGIITMEFLRDPVFKKHFVEGIFGPSELVKIFQHLLILTPIHNLAMSVRGYCCSAEYFMPSLLNLLPPAELNTHRDFSGTISPILIQYSNGWPRCGVFCCLQVYLIQHCGWKLSQYGERKPRLCAQNCVKMFFNNCIEVTLIDSISYVEIYVRGKYMNMYGPLVVSNIKAGIEAASKALHYDSQAPDYAFFCPCSVGNDSTPHSVQRHTAIVIPECKRLLCSLDSTKMYELEPMHLPWMRILDTCGITVQNLHQQLKDLSGAHLVEFGINLPVPFVVVQKIRCQEDIAEARLDLFTYIAKNCLTQGITWERIADTLATVREQVLSERIRQKYCERYPI